MDTTTLDRAAETEKKPHVAGSIIDINSFILDRYREQSEVFCSLEARMAREEYRSKYPVAPIALKCMDGRLDLSMWTKTPIGIIRAYRTLGGKFNLGWPLLAEYHEDHKRVALERGLDIPIYSTYHFSKGDPHRGCAGHSYNTEEAKADAAARVLQIRKVFQRHYPLVYPVLLGMETDDRALIFHGENGDMFAVADNLDMNRDELNKRFTELYPDMRTSTRESFLEQVMGNQSYIKEIRVAHLKPIELNHQEQIIGVGRAFDSLHLPNTALIIGPYDPNWKKWLVTAGSIMRANIEQGRIDPQSGRMLLIAKLSEDERGSSGWNFAEEEARLLLKEAQETLQEALPELFDDKFCALAGVVQEQTRQLHLVN